MNKPLQFIIVAIMSLLLTCSAANAQWVAYHDLGGETVDAAGAYVTDQGVDATQTIRLRNFDDNADTGVDFNISGANASVDNTSTDSRYPAAGTDAAYIFGAATNPIVTHGGYTLEGGNDGSGSTTFTFSGLDPGRLYDVAFYGDRNLSADGVEEFTIHGTDWHTNASSSATRINSFTSRMETRPNSVNGYVVRWADINPGSDGTFSIEIDPEYSSADNLAYVSAMRLEETAGKVPAAIYRETFGNDSGSDQGLSYAGWVGYYGSSATLLPDSGSLDGNIVNLNGAPRVATPVNSDPDSNEPDNNVLDSGFGRLLYPSGGGVSPAIVYTDEFEINRGIYSIKKFTWSQASLGGTDSFRVVIQVSSQWYVSDTAFTGPSNGSSSTFKNNGREKTLDFTTAQWRSLSFTPGATLGSPGGIVSLPSDTITAFGLYTSYNQTEQFDTFTVVAEQLPLGSVIIVQ